MTFAYSTKPGPTFTVTPDGLSSITLDGRRVARGGLCVDDAGQWFDAAYPAPGAPGKPTLVVDGKAKCHVNQTRGTLAVVTTFAFAGEDCTVTAKVTNKGTRPVPCVMFHGLFIDFATPPDGYHPEQHYTYFQQPPGLTACHPGWWQRIGGTYASDDRYGVGTSPATPGRHRTLTLWYYEDWDPTTGQAKSRSRQLLHFVHVPIPPGGTTVYRFKLRVSRDTDFRHLLAPYKAHFDATWGTERRYDADESKWWAIDFLHNDRPGQPDNPHGYQSHCRLDRADDARTYAATMIDLMRRGPTPAAGLIIWSHYGTHPRGAMYREDVDAATPAVVEANLREIVVPALKAAGFRVGIALRPADAAVPWTREYDATVRLDPSQPGHVALMKRRLDWARSVGFDAFYLDSFGNTLEDVELLRQIRQHVGPKVATFAEHVSDAALLDTAVYSEAALMRDGSIALGAGETEWRVMRWLVPGVTAAVRPRVQGDDADQARLDAAGATLRPWYRDRGLTPLTFRYDVHRWGGELPPAPADSVGGGNSK